MNWIDATILIVYMIILVGIGVYFMRKNTDEEDYFVGIKRRRYRHFIPASSTTRTINISVSNEH